MSEISDHDYTPAIGRSFGNFVVVRELGRGTMGAVFIGYQQSLKRQVAIKLLPKALARSELARRQFRDEAETVAVLSHPHIITIFERGEDDDYFYQAMQLVEGDDLASLLGKLARHPVPHRRVLPLQHSVRLISEILDGLEFAHEEGVIHQDLKPANILIDHRTGRALIADFGIAKTQQIEYYARGLVVGTPQYLSPEQAAAGDTDRRSDIYSAGVMLLEMLVGHLPVRDESGRDTVLRKIREPDSFFPEPFQNCAPTIDRIMAGILAKATAADPAQRYISARAFGQAVQRWFQSRQPRRAAP